MSCNQKLESPLLFSSKNVSHVHTRRTPVHALFKLMQGLARLRRAAVSHTRLNLTAVKRLTPGVAGARGCWKPRQAGGNDRSINLIVTERTKA